MRIEIVVKTDTPIPQKMQAFIEYNAADMKDSIKPLLDAADEALEMMLIFLVKDDKEHSKQVPIE